MRKLGKKLESVQQTIEAYYACNCYCDCSSGCYCYCIPNSYIATPRQNNPSSKYYSNGQVNNPNTKYRG